MPVGRPTKYHPGLIDRLKEYIADCPDAVPSMCGFALDNDIPEDTLNHWKARDLDDTDFSKWVRFEEFRQMLVSLHSHQKRTMLNCGAKNTLNATICKLVLAKHGYHDKLDTDITSTLKVVIDN